MENEELIPGETTCGNGLHVTHEGFSRCVCTGGFPAVAPGVTPEDIALVLRDAKARGMRQFSVKTTMKGVPLELSGTFEPNEKKRSSDGND